MATAAADPIDIAAVLPPNRPASWATEHDWPELLAISWRDYAPLQLEAMRKRFETLRGRVTALDRLAERQGVERLDRFADVLPICFDHRVYKSYPLSLIEKRDFAKLTAWLDRLTAHDLTRMDLSGLTTIDDWLTRLDEFGMIVGHSTGTTGKLSFIPRSQSEWPAWDAGFHQTSHAASGVDGKTDPVDTFFPGYRSGHQMMLKMLERFNIPAAGGKAHYHTLYPTRVSSDLMALAGRMQSAEDRGELDRLGLDPALIEARDEMIRQGRRREADMEEWFTQLIEEYRGQRVKIGGSFADLCRVAMAGNAKGLKPSFAPGSFIASGGGMKGFKDAPADWERYIKDFFGIKVISSVYGMSESTGQAPKCSHEHHHFMPYTIPIVVDRDARELPRTGTQTGRLALFDLLAESYWGGFISGDQVTIHWDEDCLCGWKGPYIDKSIARFAEMGGGDDKITCAGSTQAYNEFMDYVTQG
jgi:hypothetical protein